MAGAETMRRVRADLNAVAPSELALSRRSGRGGRPLEVGDEYVVGMPGPWDGPGRRGRGRRHGFRFVTLEGHLEADRIAWRVRDDPDGMLVFEIESWGRPRPLSALAHHHLRMAKEVQLHMWTERLREGHRAERRAADAGSTSRPGGRGGLIPGATPILGGVRVLRPTTTGSTRRACRPCGARCWRSRASSCVVIAPDGNRSAIGRGITTRRPLWVERVDFDDGGHGYATDGTPVDCVRLAALGLVDGFEAETWSSPASTTARTSATTSPTPGRSPRRWRASCSGCPAIAVSQQSDRARDGLPPGPRVRLRARPRASPPASSRSSTTSRCRRGRC